MPSKLKAGKIPLLIIAGPTAAGKSALALEVAGRLQTDIISADSAQVYRRLDIGTAKPAPEEQKLVKHHLIDLVEPDQYYSAADYQKDAVETIASLWLNGKLPLMVGGSGLYIKAVTDQFAFGEQGANCALRAYFDQISHTEGLDVLYARLQAVDPPAAAKIHPHDRRRIIRALEVYELEGEPISEQVFRTGLRESPYEIIFFGLVPDRDQLYSRIEKRVDKMIVQGFIDEVRDLYQQGYDQDAPGMQILGYRQLLIYIKGGMNLDDTLTEIKKQTRNLAKRQLTWFRRETRIRWLKSSDQSSFSDLTEIICTKVKDIIPSQANNNS